jgi:hypothetical protein
MPILTRKILGSLSRGPIEVDKDAGILIPGVKFNTAFSFGVLGGKSFMIRYLAERWNWFNQHLFGNAMKLPNFEITKNFKEVKLLGSYTGGNIRLLRIHPKLFDLKTEATVLGTLAHEMAHQYEMEITPKAYGEDSHGPTWQRIMHSIGLPTEAKYTGSRIALQDRQEREAVERFVRRASTLSFKDLSLGGNRLMDVNKISGRETPILAIGNETYSRIQHGVTCILGVSVRDLAKGIYKWYYMPYLYKLDALELKTYPAALKSELLEGKLYAAAKRYWEDVNGINP